MDQEALRPSLFAPMTGRAQQEAAGRRKPAEGRAK
jgi:hypothetical protein